MTDADGVLAVANNATTKVGTVTVTIGAGITVYHGEGGTSTFTVDAGAAALDTNLTGVGRGTYRKLLVVDSSNGDLEWVDNADDLAATKFVLGTITYVVDSNNALSSASFVQADGIETANGIRFWEDESFSQAEINDGLIRFVHSGDDKDANDAKDGRQAQFTYVLRDAGKPKADQVIGAEQTVDVTIGQVDDRPFIDDSLSDGNSDRKTADVAARTLLENTPQTIRSSSTCRRGTCATGGAGAGRCRRQECGQRRRRCLANSSRRVEGGHDAYQATKGDFMGSLATRGLSQADIDDINAKIGAMDRGAQKYLVETTSLQTDTGTSRGDHRRLGRPYERPEGPATSFRQTRHRQICSEDRHHPDKRHVRRGGHRFRRQRCHHHPDGPRRY